MRSVAGLAFAAALVLSAPAWAKAYKVLVVMSYERDNPWVKEIQDGIEAVLAQVAEISYFYMDTKADPAGGPAKAKQALAQFRALAPDGVIAADDNAQSMFVVPHLKGKGKVPVMFCGVNAEASAYGYPAANVSGILERGHLRESIAYVQQLKPSIKTISFVTKDSPSGRAMKRQVMAEKASYSAHVEGVHLVMETGELRALGRQLRDKSDAILIDSLEGVLDAAGRPLANQQVLDVLFATFQGPIVGANRYHVEQGALTAVIKTGQEQGRTAADMLLKALRGTPFSSLPVTRNHGGRRIINVNTMEKLGLKPRPIDLRGAKLVRTRR